MSCIEEDNGAGEDLTDLGVSGVFTFALRLDLVEGAEEGMAVVLSALELGLVVLGLVTSRLLDLVLILVLTFSSALVFMPGNRALGTLHAPQEYPFESKQGSLARPLGIRLNSRTLFPQ